MYVFDGYKIENKEIEQDEEPPRGTLWLKGREKKNGEYHNDEIRTVGEKIVSFTAKFVLCSFFESGINI